MGRIRGGNQDPAELAQFLGLVRDLHVRRYLEIGCRNGDTFFAVMSTIGPGGYGVAVDLPENDDSKRNLLGTRAELMASGIHTEVLHGNSQTQFLIDMVRGRGPFDLALIDGDHRYGGVEHDWVAYYGIARAVALHDVAAPDGHMSDGHENGVGQFWREIKDSFRHLEFVTPGSQMGFGVLFLTEDK